MANAQSLREKINKNPAMAAAVSGGIILIALLFIAWQCSGGSEASLLNDKAFYTTDDGKTFFVDAATNIPPYQKDGKLAVRAQVFTCDDGKTKFVGYLEMYAPQDKAMLEAMAKGAQSNKGATPAPMPYVGFAGQPLVKKPGAPANAWVMLGPQSSAAYQNVVTVKCPDGTTETLSRVFPE